MTLHKAENVNVQNKVVLTQAIAEVLEELTNTWSNAEIITDHANPEEYWSGNRLPLNDIGLDTLIRALYIGYTIEQTVEEQLLEMYEEAYNHAKTSHETQDWWSGRMDGISTSLDIIGMKVKGINA